MKRLILTGFLGLGLLSANAQTILSDAFGGAVLGTVIGGFAGGNCCNPFSGKGAAIGAGAGFAAGALLGAVQQKTAAASQPVAYYPAPVVYADPGYGYVYTPTYVAPPVYAAPPAPPPRVKPEPPAHRPKQSWAEAHPISDAPRVPDAATC